MVKKNTETAQSESIDESPILKAHTLNKVSMRLQAARQNCLQAAREIEMLTNWLDKQKPNQV
jgi:hypothetical protein